MGRYFIIAILYFGSALFAQSASWLGGQNNNDMLTGANWAGGIVPSTIAVFQGGITTPTLVNNGESFTLDSFLFPPSSNSAYTFSVSAPTTFASITFNGDGVTLQNSRQQIFNVDSNGSIVFNNSASASGGTASPPALYNLTNTFFSSSGALVFTGDATAGNAKIRATSGFVGFDNNSTAAFADIAITDNSEIDFDNTSTAGSATIMCTNASSLVFTDSATAGNSTIDLTLGSEVLFLTNASLGSAVISADGSLVTYSSTNTAAGGSVHLTNNAELSVSFSATQLAIDELSGDDNSLVDIDTSLQVGNHNASSTFSGSFVVAPGSFEKVGTGVFTMNGEGGYFGPTTITGGTYVLNGFLQNTPMTVGLNGTLKGNGILADNSLTVNGVVAPGVLTLINAPFLQAPGSTYQVAVGPGGQSSLINGLGATATIQGNTTLDVVVGGTPLLIGSAYHILHADGGVTGTYSNVISNSFFLKPHVTYTSTDIFLNLSTNFSPFARNANEACIAALLDTLSLGPLSADEEEVLGELAALNSSIGLADALDQMTGEQYTYLGQLAEYASYRFSRRLFSSVRNWIVPYCDEEVCDLSFEPWFRVEYDYGYATKENYVEGLYDNSWDLSLGTHIFAVPDVLIGIAGNYSQDYVHFIRDQQTNLLQTVEGALYGVYNRSKGYLYSNLLMGQTWSSAFKRDIRFGSLRRTAHSKPSVFQGKFYLEAGAHLDCGIAVFQPFVGGDVGWFFRNRIVERGAGFLDRVVESKWGSFGDTYVGLHLLDGECGLITLTGDLYWQHRFCSFDHALLSSFEDVPVYCQVVGNKFGENGVVGTVNLSTCLCEWELYAEFNGQRWERFTSFGATLGAHYFW